MRIIKISDYEKGFLESILRLKEIRNIDELKREKNNLQQKIGDFMDL